MAAYRRLPPAFWTISCAASRWTERSHAIDAIHRLIGFATVAVVAVGIGWSTVLVAARQTGGPRYEWLQAAVVSLIIVGAASGVVLLASGARAREAIHLFYAVIAIGLMPLARSFLDHASGRGRIALLLVAFVALGGILYRLFTTG
jgi:hypothetical protein